MSIKVKLIKRKQTRKNHTVSWKPLANPEEDENFYKAWSIFPSQKKKKKKRKPSRSLKDQIAFIFLKDEFWLLWVIGLYNAPYLIKKYIFSQRAEILSATIRKLLYFLYYLCCFSILEYKTNDKNYSKKYLLWSTAKALNNSFIPSQFHSTAD